MFYTNEKYWGDINAPWSAANWHGGYWGGMTQHGYSSAGLFGDVWARGTGAGIDEGRGDGCDSGALQMTIESCIADVEMNELRYPFLYLWRREEPDTAAPGRWRSGASISYAFVPHNTPFVTVAFRGIGKFADSAQSLDGSYPPSLGSSGPAGIYRIKNLREIFREGNKPDNVEEIRRYVKEKEGKFRPVSLSQPPVRVTENEIVLNVNSGAGGVGDPLDREPERVLDDVKKRIFSVKTAKEVFGVIVDSKRWTVDKKATKLQREKVIVRRKKRGKVWEGD
jgi:N-methylhydantoinase B